MLNWLKNALFKGLVILIPLVLLWITLRELAALLVAFATPIADALPAGTMDWVQNPELVAPILIIVIATLLGTLASIQVVRKAGMYVENKTLGKLPLYRMIKTFVTAFLELEEDASFRPALIVNDEGGAEPCYIVEDEQDQPTVVVLVPWSPASFAGSVRLVARQRIRRLDTSLDSLSLSLANFGLGMNKILRSDDAAKSHGND